MNSLLVLGIVLTALIAVSFWWRDASRRRSLPCPTWLASMLDSRWSD